ncbi:MAG: hypothetical protein WD176_06810, partial [Pirellulales bacterium]
VEAQLELVRERAAELADRLDDQERQFSAERRRWQTELAEVSRLVADQNEQGGAEGGPPVGRRPAAAARAPNPVIDSVAAQFRMVQRDAARRRTTK